MQILFVWTVSQENEDTPWVIYLPVRLGLFVTEIRAICRLVWLVFAVDCQFFGSTFRYVINVKAALRPLRRRKKVKQSKVKCNCFRSDRLFSTLRDGINGGNGRLRYCSSSESCFSRRKTNLLFVRHRPVFFCKCFSVVRLFIKRCEWNISGFVVTWLQTREAEASMKF